MLQSAHRNVLASAFMLVAACQTGYKQPQVAAFPYPDSAEVATPLASPQAIITALPVHPTTIHTTYSELLRYPEGGTREVWQGRAALDPGNDLGVALYPHYLQILEEDLFAYYLDVGDFIHEDGVVADVLSFSISPEVRRNPETIFPFVDAELAIEAGHPNASIAALVLHVSQQHSSQEAINSALHRVHLLADAGNPAAMGALADLYHHGHIRFERDFAMAEKWSALGVQHGDPQALYIRGRFFMEGTDVSQDRALGLDYYIQAAERGSQEAAYVLGLELVRQDVQERDVSSGIFWLEQAAQSGHTHAQFELAKLYSSGDLVKQDLERSIAMMYQAALADLPEAQLELAQMIKDGSGAESDPEAQLYWLYRSAANGHAPAQLVLAQHYMNLEGETQDWESALPWLERAGAQGDSNALAYLGYALQSGLGTGINLQRSLEFHKKAADLGKASSMRDLGLAYMYGQGVAVDHEAAKEWFQKALAKTDFVDAHERLGFILWQTDKLAAVPHYFKAAELGSTSAQDSLINWLSLGHYLDIDIDGTLRWLTLGAERGNVDAMKQLSKIFHAGILVERNAEEFVKYTHMAAEAGDPETQAILSQVYARGDDVEQDFVQTQYWLEQAVAQKFYPAYTMLAAMLASSFVPGDPQEKNARSLILLEEASAAGNQGARIRLNIENALRLDTDEEVDIELLERAAQGGNFAAMASLAVAYYVGTHTEQDLARAYLLGLQAAERGSAVAQYLVARILDSGEGTEKDRIESYKWMSLAAQQGHRGAIGYLPDLANIMSQVEIGSAEQRAAEWLTQRTQAVDRR